MLKIRLMRIGAKKRPFYRVVAVDERAKRTGGYLELLGTYNPLTEPHEIKLKQDRIDALVKQGAQLSDGFLRIIGKAPQRPPRKPKKEKKESEVKAATPVDTSEVKPEVNENADTSEVSKVKTETHDQPSEGASEEPKEESKNEGSA
ncbi:MAG: small subunit ribosomal protein S16 [Microgenomates group bacterium Gr01-1014_80]|nr:MAG: small subunit ribosomal protein S16 [Microgenomates group bacterium Gr01-1014_80]